MGWRPGTCPEEEGDSFRERDSREAPRLRDDDARIRKLPTDNAGVHLSECVQKHT